MATHVQLEYTHVKILDCRWKRSNVADYVMVTVKSILGGIFHDLVKMVEIPPLHDKIFDVVIVTCCAAHSFLPSVLHVQTMLCSSLFLRCSREWTLAMLYSVCRQ